MIADKVIPSFYIVEIEGDAIESIFPGDFGIQKIVFGSHDFDTDLSATSALRDTLEFITSAPHLDLTEVTEKIDFNPEFFPTLEKIALTEEQLIQQQSAEEMLDDMSEQFDNANQTAIVMSRVFDEIGDYVESRWQIHSPDFNVVGKVAVNPDSYIAEKAKEKFMQTKTLLPNLKPTVIH